jgi:hypothetical protein
MWPTYATAQTSQPVPSSAPSSAVPTEDADQPASEPSPAVPPTPAPQMVPTLPPPPPPPPPQTAVMSRVPPSPDARLHDGFYMRLSFGMGSGTATEDETDPAFPASEMDWSGLTAMFDVMLGGSPMPGFVLGGALISHQILNPTIKAGGSTQQTIGSDISLNLATIGLFTAIYPDPRSGFNFHALLGYSEVSITVDHQTTNRDNPTGPSFMAGVGYDFWVSDQWSIGPDFRIAYSEAKSDHDGYTSKVSFLAPTLSFTATYH